MSPPKVSRKLIEILASEHWLRHGTMHAPLPSHYLFAVRGYRRDTMGKPGVNDFGIWDDAMFYVSPTTFLAENANTDPSRVGWNGNAGKPMAVLNPGFWPFYRGAHRGHVPALRQFTSEEARFKGVPHDGRFSVTRTYAVGDKRNYQEAGYYAINVHPGGIVSTSSEGCQTLPKDRADEFLQTVWDETEAAKIGVIWYGLCNGSIV
jgi:lysozyme